MDKEKATRDLSVKVQPSLFSQFAQKCKENYRSISDVVRELMAKYVGMSAPKPEVVEVVEDGDRRIFYINIPSMDEVGFGKLDGDKFIARVKELLRERKEEK